MTTSYLLGLLAVTGGVTFLLRAFPFLLFGGGRKVPPLIGYAGKMISPAAIAMLTVYCLGQYACNAGGNGEILPLLPSLAASLIVVLLQLRHRNPLLSIVSGTAVYMLLIQKVIPMLSGIAW